MQELIISQSDFSIPHFIGSHFEFKPLTAYFEDDLGLWSILEGQFPWVSDCKQTKKALVL